MLIVPADHGVPGEAFWCEALRVAKPGAHLVAFGGTRTLHRLLSNPDFSRRATHFGRLVRAEDGIETACTAVGEVFGIG